VRYMKWPCRPIPQTNANAIIPFFLADSETRPTGQMTYCVQFPSFFIHKQNIIHGNDATVVLIRKRMAKVFLWLLCRA
jgi:hypothetical protein